ncbi:MAG: MFS transporter [Planctomycetota bacterium]
MNDSTVASGSGVPYARNKLMLASFLTLVAAGVGFATRTAALTAWQQDFNMSSGQFGSILGAGFLGFGMMIFFGGILVESFGYKKLLLLAFVLHLISAGLLFLADPIFASASSGSAESATSSVVLVLYCSTFLFSLCQGLYEAVINPLVADLYPDEKTHYLNILHAGWPAGMIVGGLFAAMFMGANPWVTVIPWEIALNVFVVFVLLYGVLALPEKMPPTASEGDSAGIFGSFACFASLPFLVLIVIHALVGYMELGVDSWMAALMENLVPNSIIVLVYTSALMFILRFFAGPIVHKINPIGLLLASSVIACLGLLWLGQPMTSLVLVFAAATFYSFGKAFLWPTMLAVAGERYPRSGAVAMGALGAAGMLTVGLVANPRIGAQQGDGFSTALQEAAPETFERYAEAETTSSWGYEYRPISGAKAGAAKEIKIVDGVADTTAIVEAEQIPEDAKDELIANASTDVPAVAAANLVGGRSALIKTATIPAAMALGFLGLFVYYRSIGGYKPVSLGDSETDPRQVTTAAQEDLDVVPGLDQPAASEY